MPLRVNRGLLAAEHLSELMILFGRVRGSPGCCSQTNQRWSSTAKLLNDVLVGVSHRLVRLIEYHSRRLTSQMREQGVVIVSGCSEFRKTCHQKAGFEPAEVDARVSPMAMQ